jgi:hypothetical protein
VYQVVGETGVAGAPDGGETGVAGTSDESSTRSLSKSATT